nr:neuropeptides capa receptor [Bemisia tabaci]
MDGLAFYNSSSYEDPFDTQNETLEQLLNRLRGPKHLPLEIVLPITIVYVSIFLTGVAGNLAVCLVIVRNSSMHTATNYYLFNLAVSDLTLLLLGLPNDLSVYWQQYPWMFGVALCKLRALVSEMGSGLLVYESAFCAMLDSNMPANCPIYELSFLIFFLIPMLIIIVLYVRIGLKIRKRNRHSLGKRVEGTVHGETKNFQSRKSIIRMLSAVVITFFLCWAPFHAQRLMYVYARDTKYFSELNEWVYYITGGLYYVSSTVNPILYNLMSVKYRNAFKQTLCSINSHSSRSRDRFSRDIQSSFRDTIVEVGHDSPQWNKKSVKSKPLAQTDVVVMVKPANNACTGANGREHSPLL